MLELTVPTPLPSVTSRKVHAICTGADDRLMVMFAIDPRGMLDRHAGKWLRALRTTYGDELELLVFIRRPQLSRDTCGKHDAAAWRCVCRALSVRLRRLRLPQVIAVESCWPPADRRHPLSWVRQRTWVLLDDVERAAEVDVSGSEPVNAPGGALIDQKQFSLFAGGAGDEEFARHMLLDVGVATNGLAYQTARVAALSDARLVDGERCIGGVIIDGLGAARIESLSPQGSHVNITDALDVLANAVHTRRITRATRRSRSIWNSL